MKILIIVSDVGRTAPGLVFEKIINGLAKEHKLLILTSKFQSKMDVENIKVFEHPSNKFQSYHFKLFYALFSNHPADFVWSRKAINLINNYELSDVDLIISQISNHHYTPIIAGRKIANRYNKKHIIHSVDAIPAPGWPENKLYIWGVKRFFKKYLKNIDGYFASNKKMLDFQLSTFKSYKKIYADVIYNPIDYKHNTLNKSNKDFSNFLYTGKIYGARKSKYLLAAFERLLVDYPDSRLIFLGTWKDKIHCQDLQSDTVSKIISLPFQKNLEQYYSDATALIDIDADLAEDVFLSSKIINYLPINRIIISETSINSPSYILFRGINSIIQCNHDSTDIYLAMKEAIEFKKNIKFDDRDHVIDLFYIDNVIRKLNNALNIINKN